MSSNVRPNCISYCDVMNYSSGAVSG